MEQLPTIVSCFYNIRKKENFEGVNNRSFERYLDLASKFILKLPYPLIFFTDDLEISKFVQSNRKKNGLLHKTFIYYLEFEKLYYYQHLGTLQRLVNEYPIYNGRKDHETPMYIILNNSKFDFIERAIQINYFESKYFMWMDFGINHVAEDVNKIHQWILYIPDKIKQICINPYVENDNPKDLFHNIFHHTAGGLFTGSSENLLEYGRLFKMKTEKIYQEDWYQIDEAVMTMVQRENPHLFEFYYGDYQGIIANYMEPVFNLNLIITGLEKAYQYCRFDVMFQISKYLINYYMNEDTHTDDNKFIIFLTYQIICNFYGNNGYLMNEVIMLFNHYILKRDSRIKFLLDCNQANLAYYKNKDMILKFNEIAE